jgi:hypothetical protein
MASESCKASSADLMVQQCFVLLQSEEYEEVFRFLVLLEQNVELEMESLEHEKEKETVGLYQKAVIVYQYLATFHQLYPPFFPC